MKTARCNYRKCKRKFTIKWGPGAFGNALRYCTLGCGLEERKARSNDRNRAKRWNKDKKRLHNRKKLGRQCKWKHCRVTDVYHLNSWNSVPNICPSCYRQSERVGSCRCGGPLYYLPPAVDKVTYCPTCTPRKQKAGQISVTLVCSETGMERQIVRNKSWVLTNGIKLSDVATEDGFAVIDVEPKVWANYRV